MGSKWFSKLGIALAGIAMAVGVGVGLGQKEFKKAEAAAASHGYGETNLFNGAKVIITTLSEDNTPVKYYIPANTAYTSNSGINTQPTFTNINSLDEAHIWTVSTTTVDDKTAYIFSTTINSTTHYLRVSGNNNGKTPRIGTENTYNSWFVESVQNYGYSLKNTYSGFYLGVYNGATSDWRVYNSTTHGNFVSGTGRNFVFYAPKYTVTYDANTGTGEMTDSNSPYVNNTTVTVKDNSFTKQDYSFSGWNTKADGEGIDYNPNDTFKITTDVTLYAMWVSASQPSIIISSSSNLNGYTGQAFSVTVTFVNLTSDFVWGSPTGTGSISGEVTEATGTSTNGTSTYSGTLTGAGSVELTTSGGGVSTQNCPTVSFSITASTVTISGLPTTAVAYIGGPTLNLGSKITVTSQGVYTNDVTWESKTPSVATVDQSGVVTTIAAGSSVIVVKSVSDNNVSQSCTVTVEALPKYTLATNLTQIVHNSKVLIAAEYNSKTYVMNSYNANNVSSTVLENSDFDSGRIKFDGDKMTAFTVELSASGYVLHDVVNNKYLYNASTSGNNGKSYLRGNESSAHANSYWNITFTNSLFEIINLINTNRPKIMLNYNDSSNIFFNNYETNTGTSGGTGEKYSNVKIYVLNASPTASAKVDAFARLYMHPEIEDNETTRASDTETCFDYFDAARAALDQESGAWSSIASDFHDSAYWERYVKWGKARGVTVTYNNGIQYSRATFTLDNLSRETNNNLFISIIIIAGVSALAIGGYFFIRRKHQ